MSTSTQKKQLKPVERDRLVKKSEEVVQIMVRDDLDKEKLLLDIQEKVKLYRESLFSEDRDEDEYFEREQELKKSLLTAMNLTTVETHSAIAKTVEECFQPLVASVADDLISEYQATSPSERMTAQLAASAYVRYIQYSTKFNLHGIQESISDTKNSYFALFAKEVDRAFRQYRSAICLLKQMKAPSLNVVVNTKAAFVATNQQINAEKSNYERNAPK